MEDDESSNELVITMMCDNNSEVSSCLTEDGHDCDSINSIHEEYQQSSLEQPNTTSSPDRKSTVVEVEETKNVCSIQEKMMNLAFNSSPSVDNLEKGNSPGDFVSAPLTAHKAELYYIATGTRKNSEDTITRSGDSRNSEDRIHQRLHLTTQQQQQPQRQATTPATRHHTSSHHQVSPYVFELGYHTHAVGNAIDAYVHNVNDDSHNNETRILEGIVIGKEEDIQRKNGRVRQRRRISLCCIGCWAFLVASGFALSRSTAANPVETSPVMENYDVTTTKAPLRPPSTGNRPNLPIDIHNFNMEDVIATVPETMCMDTYPGAGESDTCSYESSLPHGGHANNLLAWAMYDYGFPACEIVLTSAGAIAYDIPKGDFRVSQVYELLSFEAPLVTMVLTGKEVITVVEHAVRTALRDSSNHCSCFYPYAAALRFDVNASAVISEGEMMTSNYEVFTGEVWKELDLYEEQYATVAYLVDPAHGPNAYEKFVDIIRGGNVEAIISTTVFEATDVFLKYAVNNGILAELAEEEFSTKSFVPSSG